MNIRELGGEFALIDRLCRQTPVTHPDLLTGIGDDAAVLHGTPPHGEHLLITTDMLVEGTHFNCQWATPEQIGIKSVASNVSDIAAMGGVPTFMVVSLALPQTMDVAWVDALYQGIGDACRTYGVVLAGGDTTHGTAITVAIALLGRVTPSHLRLRSQARPGELLCVTGPLGASAAGLALLQAGIDPPAYLKEKHLAPTCRLDVSSLIAPLAHAMIDISDGLASEVNHICDASGTGAEVVAADIPIHPEVRDAASRTGNDAYGFALSGGEDYELLFSISPQNLHQLAASGVQSTVIGRVTASADGRHLRLTDGRRLPLAGGYDHFG